jgi:hypothetical protein
VAQVQFFWVYSTKKAKILFILPQNFKCQFEVLKLANGLRLRSNIASIIAKLS